MRQPGAETKSALAESAGADFAMLAARCVRAEGALLELLDGSRARWGSQEGAIQAMPVVLQGHPAGSLILFDAKDGLEGLGPVLRRLEHHLLREEALAFAEHAHGAAATAARRFEALFEGVPVACYSVDAEGRLMEWNVAAETRWGPALALAWGGETARIVRPDEPDAAERLVARALGGESVREGWASAFPLRDGEGSVVGAVVTSA